MKNILLLVVILVANYGLTQQGRNPVVGMNFNCLDQNSATINDYLDSVDMLGNLLLHQEHIKNNAVFPEDLRSREVGGCVDIYFKANYKKNGQIVGIPYASSTADSALVVEALKVFSTMPPFVDMDKKLHKKWMHLPIQFETHIASGFYGVEPPIMPATVSQSKSDLVAPAIEIIEFPDKEASFPGGMEAMMLFIKQNIVYPKGVTDQGKVYVSFVVGPKGVISSIVIVRGLTPDLDREAKRIMRIMPAWIPGEKNEKPVYTRFQIPIVFSLD